MVNLARVIKNVIGVGLVSGGIGYLAYDHVVLSASYAVIAAPSLNVDAPCDGIISQVVSNYGVLPSGGSLGTVKPMPLDDPTQRAAQAELETGRVDADALKRLVALTEGMRQKSDRRSNVLTERRGAHLTQLFQLASLNEAKQQAAAAAACAYSRSSPT